MWHLVQVSDVLDIEFGAALAERVPLMAWEPARQWIPWSGSTALKIRRASDLPLQIHSFPVMRGFSRFPLSILARTGESVCRTLLAHTPDPARTPLICTIPYFASLAERWPGPVVYWLTDRMECYEGVNARTVHKLDRRMCRAASLVCPNSNRLAEYLTDVGECEPGKIRIVPNATRAANVFTQVPSGPGALPPDLADLRRPIAGVLGNLAGNLDWTLLEELIDMTPHMQWAMVGPYDMPIKDSLESAARERVMHRSNVLFTGRKSYGELASYARALDVAVLPYRLCEPTFSGSSTRFYEHLAAGRPMLATRGFEELLHKQPLVTLYNTAQEAADILQHLKRQGFRDGHETLRWEHSQQGTWQARAAFLQAEVDALLTPNSMRPTSAGAQAARSALPVSYDDRRGVR